MRIVIIANPEQLSSITFYDGIGNQIYPPANIAFNDIISYIKHICNEFDIAEIDIKGPHDYIAKLTNNLKNTFKTVNIVEI